MKDENKTKAQLIEELNELRRRDVERETAEKRQQILSRVRDEVWKMKRTDDIRNVLKATRIGLETLNVPFQACDINLVDSSGDSPTVYYYTSLEGGKWRGGREERGRETILQIWQEKKVAYRHDLRTEDVYQERTYIEQQFGNSIRSVVDVPFAFGTLAVNSAEPHAFSDSDIAFLQELTEVLSEGFHRLDDLRQVEQRNRELEKEITEHKQSGEALKESEEQFRVIAEQSLFGFSILQDGKYIYMNAAAGRITGFLHEEVKQWDTKDFLRLIHPDDVPIVMNEVKKKLEEGSGEVSHYFYRLYDKHGKLKWIENYSKAIEIKGKPADLIIFADITDHKRAEEELHRQKEWLEVTLSCIGDAVIATDTSETILFINPVAEALTGWPSQEAVGQKVDEVFRIINEQTRQPDENPIRRVLEEGVIVDLANHTALISRDGRELSIADSGAPIVGIDGITQGVVMVFRDVTERKQVEEALRESEERYRSLVEAPPNLVVMVMAPDGAYRYVSPQIETLTGYLPKEFYVHTELGKYITHPDDFEEGDRAFRQALESTPVQNRELRWKHRDGTYRWAFETIFPLFNESGGVGAVQAVFQDITDRKRMEEDLRRAHNLESLGVLAGGIAHDFNNVLTGVMGNLALLLRFLDKDSEEYEIASEAQQAANKTKGLTQQLMTFSKGGAPVKKTASIEQLIRETTNLSLHGANTRPEFHFPDDLSSVDIDTGQIGQVIQNLVINADQAMPNGGTLKISADNVEVSDEDPLPLEAGTYVRVTVEDQGVGIPESILSQVFDPYFSTKETGHGLGLSITYSIIQRHSGHITVSSEQNVGTTFELYLPASEKQAITVAETEQGLARGSGRILLMDDEETIHQTVGRVLKALGYDVSSAYDGEEVLQMYKAALESGEPFDVVIMDLTIPGGMGGKEAVGRLREIDSQARVIVSSGYANDPVMANFADYGFAGSVAKPVDIEELAGAVKSVLAGRSN